MEPPNRKASEAAVQSIIGEVFSNVSFEEFERSNSTVSCGVCAQCKVHSMINISFYFSQDQDCQVAV